jgi:hypothetical protein
MQKMQKTEIYEEWEKKVKQLSVGDRQVYKPGN